MKKIFVLCVTLLLCLCQLFSQKSIVMKIPNVTSAAGEEVRSLDLDLLAASSWTKGGGASVGKPNPGPVIIRKQLNKSTVELLKAITTGKPVAELSFEFLDPSKKVMYSIQLTAAYVTQVAWVSPECSGCPSSEMQLSFHYKTFKLTDNVNGLTLTWDIPAGTVL